MTQPLGNCPGCGGDEPFEQVHPGQHTGGRCPDVEGECAEWVCTGCGTGVFMGTTVFPGGGVFREGGAFATAGTPSQTRPVQSVRAA
jgi:hypothetical protein